MGVPSCDVDGDGVDAGDPVPVPVLLSVVAWLGVGDAVGVCDDVCVRLPLTAWDCVTACVALDVVVVDGDGAWLGELVWTWLLEDVGEPDAP